MNNPIYTMGIDIGSAASKCVILKDGESIAAYALYPSGAGTAGPDKVIDEALLVAGISSEDIAFKMATGYGRHSIDADEEMSELTCHAKGAVFILPGVRTVIDIGGQDFKILEIDNNGMLASFLMNEKCAAGTGRFLEVMSRVLDVPLEEMGELSSKSENIVDISSTCTVFAESEVISQLAQNKNRNDILAGIHRSVASRVAGIARRIRIESPILLTGGVAPNDGVKQALRNELEQEIITDKLSAFAGALGAAILAYEKHIKNEE